MGFDEEKFTDLVSTERKCGLCRLVLDNPVRTPCNHNFCSGCILPWVVRHGYCPNKCQALTPNDLENVLPMRELILNMKVWCDFRDQGCSACVRLTDLIAHTQECQFRSVPCRNAGCNDNIIYKELSQHEHEDCEYRRIGTCERGCGLLLIFKSTDNHDCLAGLKETLKLRDQKIASCEREMRGLATKLVKREKYFISKIAKLQNDTRLRKIKYQHGFSCICVNEKRKSKHKGQEYRKLTLTLQRGSGALGLNIMGGFSPDNENNNGSPPTVSDGIIISHVLENGSAEKNGLHIYDQILKVNGQDLSQATHEEAVEAFRKAKEPIVVEVLRRVNKTKVKSRSPTMVSIGTQTDEDIYGLNRPPTPPPGCYSFQTSGLCQPASRRPVVFSPSADMGLTDIEMAHQFEYDDPYFDERPYDVEYEEVTLHRPSNHEKLGLTLCYGSLEDDMTDIFISEVEACSIAANDGRIREGDQILQINGMDVHSRDQAIKLFAEQSAEISLLLARPQFQLDDGFMDENNVVLDDLRMDILEKHHQDNMQIMASMLARGHIDEEGGTTDTATTENSHKHEKDSGVGRTDESTKNDESSEQENFDGECSNSTAQFQPECGLGRNPLHRSTESFTSNDVIEHDVVNNISVEECKKFREVLANRCIESRRKNSESSIENEIALLNKEMEDIQFECQEIVEAHMRESDKAQLLQKEIYRLDPHRSPRVVPRMGTRLEYMKHLAAHESPEQSLKRDGHLPKLGQHSIKGSEKDTSTTSAYNTGESCRSTPLTLELNQGSDEDKDFKNSMLCLATPTNNPSVSDTEKQTQTPGNSQECSSEENIMYNNNNKTPNGNVEVKNMNDLKDLRDHGQMGESLQDIYMKYSDVMYTNHANLQHTIAIQQRLFQQQMDQRSRVQGNTPRSPSVTESGQNQTDPQASATPPDSGQMEWVVKRRPDGTRYVTRRPIRNKMLKERAKKISEERCGMTTDDDTMSELKLGRYWSKGERKRHLEKAKDHKKKRELMKAKMDTLKEADEKKELNIVEMSHRKMMRRKGKKVLDNFTTVQEMLAHGSKVAEGKTYNPLLSVTTV